MGHNKEPCNAYAFVIQLKLQFAIFTIGSMAALILSPLSPPFLQSQPFPAPMSPPFLQSQPFSAACLCLSFSPDPSPRCSVSPSFLQAQPFLPPCPLSLHFLQPRPFSLPCLLSLPFPQPRPFPLPCRLPLVLSSSSLLLSYPPPSTFFTSSHGTALFCPFYSVLL